MGCRPEIDVRLESLKGLERDLTTKENELMKVGVALGVAVCTSVAGCLLAA